MTYTNENKGQEIKIIKDDLKSKICRDFMRNVCSRGRKCKFKHPSAEELNEIVDCSDCPVMYAFCHDFQNTNKCQRHNCRFIHGTIEEEKIYTDRKILPRRLKYQYDFGLQEIYTHVVDINGQSCYPDAKTVKPVCQDFLRDDCKRGKKCKFGHPKSLNSENCSLKKNFPFTKRKSRFHVADEKSPKRFKLKQDDDGSVTVVNSTSYTKQKTLEEENHLLKMKLAELEKKVSDLSASNEYLLEQNAQFRCLKKGISVQGSAPVVGIQLSSPKFTTQTQQVTTNVAHSNPNINMSGTQSLLLTPQPPQQTGQPQGGGGQPQQQPQPTQQQVTQVLASSSIPTPMPSSAPPQLRTIPAQHVISVQQPANQNEVQIPQQNSNGLMSSQPPSLQPPPPNHFVSPPPPQQHVVSVAMPVSMAMQQQPRLMSMQLPIASHQQTLVYSHPTRASALTEGNPLSTVSLSALPPPSIPQPQVDPQPPPQQVMVRTAPVSQQQIYGSQASSLNSSFPAIFTADNRSIISYSAAPDTSCITAAVGGNYQSRKPPQKSDWRMGKK